jgi:hypothetical protein
VALFIKFEEVEGESEMALRALSNSTGLGFAHFGALAGVGKGQHVSTACKCFTKFAFG